MIVLIRTVIIVRILMIMKTITITLTSPPSLASKSMFLLANESAKPAISLLYSK